MAHDTSVYRLLAGAQEVASHIEIADTMLRRGRGLMFRADLPEGHGIVIKPCSSIHMFFMRIPIDVAFVDAEGRVLHMCDSIRPWRISRIVWRAKAAIEIRAGRLREAGVKPGDVLTIVPAEAEAPGGR